MFVQKMVHFMLTRLSANSLLEDFAQFNFKLKGERNGSVCQ